MEDNNTQDLYIKLSRIRDDYGIEGRQGTSLHLSELEGFTIEQLRTLKAALEDECQDIEYQVGHEMKYHEKDAKWMYGCKNSLKARQRFVARIQELLFDGVSETEIAMKFMRVAKQNLSSTQYASLLSIAQGKSEVFSAQDMQ